MTDPLGLTAEQRAWSDASAMADREAPKWWTQTFRDVYTMSVYLEEARRRRGLRVQRSRPL